MFKAIPDLLKAEAKDNFSLHLIFADGIEGIIDLSDIERTGFFEVWNTHFDKFTREGNILSWDENCQMDADSFYLKLINKDFFEYAGN